MEEILLEICSHIITMEEIMKRKGIEEYKQIMKIVKKEIEEKVKKEIEEKKKYDNKM